MQRIRGQNVSWRINKTEDLESSLLLSLLLLLLTRRDVCLRHIRPHGPHICVRAPRWVQLSFIAVARRAIHILAHSAASTDHSTSRRRLQEL